MRFDLGVANPHGHAKSAARLMLAFGTVAGKQGGDGAGYFVLNRPALALPLECSTHDPPDWYEVTMASRWLRQSVSSILAAGPMRSCTLDVMMESRPYRLQPAYCAVISALSASCGSRIMISSCVERVEYWPCAAMKLLWRETAGVPWDAMADKPTMNC